MMCDDSTRSGSARARGRSLLLALLAVAAACTDQGGPTESELAKADRGRFRTAVGGALEASLEGTARHDAAPGGTGIFSIKLVTDDQGYYVSLLRRDRGRPATGTYAAGTPREPTQQERPPFSAGLTLLGNDPANNSWEAEEGTVTITRSSPGEIEGTFEFRATRWYPGDGQPRPITARGAFYSTCTPGQQCP